MFLTIKTVLKRIVVVVLALIAINLLFNAVSDFWAMVLFFTPVVIAIALLLMAAFKIPLRRGGKPLSLGRSFKLTSYKNP